MMAGVTSSNTKLAQHPLMIAAMLIAAATGAIGFVALPTSEPTQTYAVEAPISGHDMDQLRSDMARMEKTLEKTKNGSSSPDYATLRTELDLLKAKFSDLDSRQRNLERVIMASPAKALELPMMRKDIDDIKVSRDRDQIYNKDSLDRLYTIYIGSIVALASSLLLMAFDRFYGGRAKGSVQG